MNNERFEEIMLYEIREVRKDVQELKSQVFANKFKLGIFVSFLTILLNILIVVIAEKIKIFLA